MGCGETDPMKLISVCQQYRLSTTPLLSSRNAYEQSCQAKLLMLYKEALFFLGIKHLITSFVWDLIVELITKSIRT